MSSSACYGSLVITGLTNSADTATNTSVLRHRRGSPVELGRAAL
jgi:hypothetical protein